MKAKIYVTLKDGIHDPQGKAISHALSVLGFSGVIGVRAGKFFELELADQSPETAKESIGKMCDQLLANTVIEKYRYEIVDEDR